MKLIKCKGINCKNTFIKRVSGKNKFCKPACALSVVRTKEHQIKAGKKGALINILKYRGTGTKTYVKENGRHQHRVVMEKHIGRKLKKDEIVHHIDHNKKNNNINNLLIMTRAQHAMEHSRKHPLFCVECDMPSRTGYKYCSRHQSQMYRNGKIT